MEVALKVKAKNAVLQRFIEEKGWSQSRFAKEVGYTATQVGRWFNLSAFPGEKHMSKVCELVGETDEVIFPMIMRKKDFLDMGKNITFYKELDTVGLIGNKADLLMAPSEEDPLEAEDQKRIIKESMEMLTYREKKVLVLKFGLEGCRQMKNAEIARLLGVSSTRVGHIVHRAVRRLSQPYCSKKLEECLPPERGASN